MKIVINAQIVLVGTLVMDDQEIEGEEFYISKIKKKGVKYKFVYFSWI